MSNARHPLALRIPPDQLEAIDVRARRAGLSRTEYMVRSALGDITDPKAADEVLAQHEERLARIEAALFSE